MNNHNITGLIEAVEPQQMPRIVVLGMSFALIFLFTYIFCQWLVAQFFPGNGLLDSLTTVVAIALSVALCWALLEKRFLVRNNTTGGLVTQDPLASLFRIGSLNYTYGPGVHLSFPWEKRYRDNNFSLEEAFEELEFIVQCQDGILKGNGSFRLRPDYERPVTFLGSVAAVAGEMKDLIIASVQEYFQDKKVKDAAKCIPDLNKYLKDRWAGDEADEAEIRNGVRCSDVTISKLLPSEELQRSISAIAEAEAVKRGTEIILGMSLETAEAKVEAGTLSRADINEARDRFLSISGNSKEMEIKRQDYNVNLRGLDSEAIVAIADLLKTPAGQAVVATSATASRGRGGGQKKG